MKNLNRDIFVYRKSDVIIKISVKKVHNLYKLIFFSNKGIPHNRMNDLMNHKSVMISLKLIKTNFLETLFDPLFLFRKKIIDGRKKKVLLRNLFVRPQK